jgi:hypothetical protein
MEAHWPSNEGPAVRQRGIRRHGKLGRDPPSRPRRRPQRAGRLPRVQDQLEDPQEDPRQHRDARVPADQAQAAFDPRSPPAGRPLSFHFEIELFSLGRRRPFADCMVVFTITGYPDGPATSTSSWASLVVREQVQRRRDVFIHRNYVGAGAPNASLHPDGSTTGFYRNRGGDTATLRKSLLLDSKTCESSI